MRVRVFFCSKFDAKTKDAANISKPNRRTKNSTSCTKRYYATAYCINDRSTNAFIADTVHHGRQCPTDISKRSYSPPLLYTLYTAIDVCVMSANVQSRLPLCSCRTNDPPLYEHNLRVVFGSTKRTCDAMAYI